MHSFLVSPSPCPSLRNASQDLACPYAQPVLELCRQYPKRRLKACRGITCNLRHLLCCGRTTMRWYACATCSCYGAHTRLFCVHDVVLHPSWLWIDTCLTVTPARLPPFSTHSYSQSPPRVCQQPSLEGRSFPTDVWEPSSLWPPPPGPPSPLSPCPPLSCKVEDTSLPPSFPTHRLFPLLSPLFSLFMPQLRSRNPGKENPRRDRKVLGERRRPRSHHPLPPPPQPLPQSQMALQTHCQPRRLPFRNLTV